MFHKGTILNWDSDSEYFFFKHYCDKNGDVRQKAKEYIESIYTNCGISDIIFNVFSQISLTPSKVFTDKLTKYLCKKENGIEVDYSNNFHLADQSFARQKNGFGPTEIWIEHCKSLGINPWISIRMNDNHYRDEVTSFLRSDFFYEALEKGWMLGDGYRSGYRNFNYAIPEVREKMLDYIREQLNLFDVYGVEWDFTREAKCLRYLHEENVSQHMNLFMEQAKAIVEEAEKLRGHKIKINVRLPRDIKLCEKIGFDCVFWAKKGLTDYITPSGHFLCNDTGMPIQQWVEALSPYGVKVWAGMEMCLPNKLHITSETAKAHTVQYSTQGSSKTYIFNYYHPYLHYCKELGLWHDDIQTEDMRELWRVSGDIDLCLQGCRRHILTEESFGFGEIKPRWAPLPAELDSANSLEIQTGFIPQKSKVTLFLGVEDGDFPKITVNGKNPTTPQKASDPLIKKNPTVDLSRIAQYDISQCSFEQISQKISVLSPCKLFYAEIKIDQ